MTTVNRPADEQRLAYQRLREDLALAAATINLAAAFKSLDALEDPAVKYEILTRLAGHNGNPVGCYTLTEAMNAFREDVERGRYVWNKTT